VELAEFSAVDALTWDDLKALRAWLLDQLDDDERSARAAGSAAWRRGTYNIAAEWDDEEPAWLLDSDAVTEADEPHQTVVYDEGRPDAAQTEHIARHNPAAVLADVAAKRAIVAEYLLWTDDDAGEMRTIGYREGLETALRHLAAGYSSRDGYRSEWRPRT
jgi:hypothetical protein